MTHIRLNGQDCQDCGCLTVPRATWYKMTRAQRDKALAEGVRRFQGRGMCTACYQRHRQDDTLTDHELRLVPNDWMVEEYEHLRRDLPNTAVDRLEAAAKRIGTTPRALEKALERAGVAA